MRRARIASFLAATALAGCATAPGPSGPWGPTFFDDFGYAATTDMQAAGWTLRTGTGHPGLPGGRFDAAMLTLRDDPDMPGNRVLRLSARTDGTGPGTVQAQLCQQRKFFRGTYAARVRFSDAPSEGVDGDPIVQSFYAVAPLAHDFDPEFSEVDWEYLPNGGWGSRRTRLYNVSWNTVRIDPWESHNSMHEEFGSFEGWHVLVMQVTPTEVREFVDGRRVAIHSGRNVPVQPMAIAFNLWFAVGGTLPTGGTPRVYDEDVDWVFHARDAELAPAEVDARVRALREAGTARVDTVPAPKLALESRCDF